MYPGSFYDPNAYAAPDPVYDAANSDFDNEPPLLEGKVTNNSNNLAQ